MTKITGLALAAAVVLASACLEEETATPTYGNVLRTCTAGSPCDCTVTGNCVFDCPGGGCEMRCLGAQANCVFSCAGGGCAIDCAAGTTGNCVSTCTGGGCDLTCTNVGNCALTGCPTGTCTAACQNLGTCSCATGCQYP